MRLLVTGGTGLIGEGVIPCLLAAGHDVRILSRGACEDARQWPEHVEAFPADVADCASLAGAADGCHAVVHIVGIAKETRDKTFAAINVDGTRNVVAEAERAGARRLVFMSSLGADRGKSEYHRSKRAAEEIVRGFKGGWVILRPGKVYGPGDEAISMLLGMVRTLPIVPVVAAGDQNFQPIWYRDLGAAVAKVIEMEHLSGVTLEIAGNDVTTTDDILDRLSKLTGKSPPRLGVPSVVVSIGARVADLLGVDLPIDRQKLTMLLEENVIEEGKPNALVETLGITPVRLSEALAELVDIQPEQVLGEGVGAIELKRFWANIVDAPKDATELMASVKAHIKDIMPIDFAAEPGAPTTLAQGATMTGRIPVRGTIQMRVEESSLRQVTLATLRGHPIAGVVRFRASDRSNDGIRFEVIVFSQAADLADWVVLQTAAAPAQNANWNTVVERVVELSGGTAPDGVGTEMTSLDEEEAGEAEAWIREMILGRKRAENQEALRR
jgi:uncharacterized protein YbjT (DUF2867 family)